MDLKNLTVTDVTGTYTVHSERGRYEQMTDRPSFGLSFCLDGQITYVQNGERAVSDRLHAILLPKGGSYLILGDKTGDFPVINFSCTEPPCDRVTAIPISNVMPFAEDYKRIRELLLLNGSRAEVMSLFYGILHRLSAQNEAGELLPALQYIDAHYDDPTLSNSTLARECRISEVYFRRLFVRQIGVSPKQYVIDLRVRRAKQLLSEGALKINAVAQDCGFAGPYHFCRVFRERTGLTPTEYRRTHQIVQI